MATENADAVKGLVDRLLAAIAAQHKRIVVIGDAMMDHWSTGQLEDCQDGCQKFVQGSWLLTPGGAANAQRSLSNWNVDTDLYAFSGNDRPQKWRFVDTTGKIVFRWDNETIASTADRSRYKWAYNNALEMVGCASAVLISDYDKGFLTPYFIRTVADRCSRCNIPCVADCSRAPETYPGCILKCNADYQRAYNESLSALVYDADTPQRLVVTAGPLNPLVWGGTMVTGIGCSLPSVACINHVGAGDCFAAHLALALAYGFSLKEAAALAHAAGRVYVQYPHSQPPHPCQIKVDLASAVSPPNQ